MNRDFQSQSAPFIIDGDDLTLYLLAGGIAHLAEKVAVKPPFEVRRVLGDDGVLVLIVECNPLAVNLDFRSRDSEYDALVIAFF